MRDIEKKGALNIIGAMILIDCKDVEFAYDGRPVLSGVNFSVEEGDYLCIVGENGAGKSTLLRGLLKLKKPNKGEIEFSGVKSGEIGYLPQQTLAQRDFPASVEEVVLSGRLNSLGLFPFYKRADRAEVEEVMEKLEILPLKKRCYRELSGGQQQRVLLARALCATKKLLILDEPVTGLDPIISGELYRIIKGVNESGITVIMVSHDVCGAIEAATHVLHLGECAQVFFGNPKDYMQTEAGKYFLTRGS